MTNVYIDVINGSDENGNGTIQSPYKNLQYFLNTVAVKTNADYTIFLQDGSYVITSNTIFGQFTSGTITIIGKGYNTEIVQNVAMYNNSVGGSLNFSLTIAKCRYNISLSLSGTPNLIGHRWRWTFTNVLMEYIPNNGTSVFSASNNLTFINCVKLTNSTSFLRKNSSVITVSDSIGYFTSGYQTTQSDWDAGNNVIGSIDGYQDFLNRGMYPWLDSKTFIFNDGGYKNLKQEIIIDGQEEDSLPILTSETQDGITVTSSTVREGTLLSIFDKNQTTYATFNTGYIEVNYGEPTHISKYSITTRNRDANDVSASPRLWDLEGSNDGISWSKVDTVDFQFTAKSQTQEFEVNGEHIYNRYRLNVSANNGYNGQLFTFADIYLYKKDFTSNTYWNTVTTSTPSIQQFQDEGMSSLSPLLDVVDGVSPLDELNGDIEVVTWVDDVSLEKKVRLQVEQFPQLAYAKDDISLVGVESIDNISLTANEDSKVALSFDEGVTWLAFRNDTWNVVDNAEDGMTSSEINALTSYQIEDARNGSKTIRFSYYLNGDAEVDEIKISVTLSGTERIARTTDYDVDYDEVTSTIIYNIKKSGTYSFNYVDA